MQDGIGIFLGAVTIAAIAVGIGLIVYIGTRPIVFLPIIALIAFLSWRRYKRSRV